MSEIACRTCAWWEPVLGEKKGKCHRFPPLPTPGGYAFPIVPGHEWCGEHGVREGERPAGA